MVMAVSISSHAQHHHVPGLPWAMPQALLCHYCSQLSAHTNIALHDVVILPQHRSDQQRPVSTGCKGRARGISEQEQGRTTSSLLCAWLRPGLAVDMDVCN